LDSHGNSRRKRKSLFQSSTDDLNVRRQVDLRRQRKAIESFDALFVLREFKSSECRNQLGVADIDVVPADTEPIIGAAREDAFAANTEAVEVLHEVRIAIRDTELAEDADPVTDRINDFEG
jgi:hypothetical protein